MYTQRTFQQNEKNIEKKWFILDAADLVLGRFATQVADVLRGKNKPYFSPNADFGDYVIVVNSEKVRLTGDKWDKKIYYTHSNHVGGLKERTAKQQLEKHPELIVYNAIKGMLPKTSLGRRQLKKLKVVIGPDHKFEAQKPAALTL